MSDMLLAFSNGPASNTQLLAKEYTWEQLAQRMATPKVGGKDGSYLVRGGHLKEAERGNENLLDAELLVIDGDSSFDPETGECFTGTDEDEPNPAKRIKGNCTPIEVAREALDKLGYRYIIHTTHTHTPGILNKWRAYIPAKMGSPAELEAAVEFVMAQMHAAGCYVETNRESKTWAQAWYLPRVKPKYLDSYRCYASLVGRDVDVPAAVAVAKAQRKAAEAATKAQEAPKPEHTPTGPSPIERFNNGATMATVKHMLEQAGYKFAYRRGDSMRFIAPGSESGTPGVTVFKGSKRGDICAYSHHGAHDPLSGRLNDAFGMLTRLRHAGNMEQAMVEAKAAIAWAEKRDPLAGFDAEEITPEDFDKAREDAKKPTGPTQPVPISSPWGEAVTDIPPREWIIRGLMIRKHISILVAPGGSGKSLLSAQWGIALALGMSWGGWQPVKAENVLLINAEDDGDEMRRRIHAACYIMGVTPADLIGKLFIADDPRSIVIAKTNRDKVVVATPLADAIRLTMTENNIGVVVVDPFAETFEGDENSNSEVKWAAAIWRSVARECGCSVMLVHHTPKYAKGMAGDADAARGAGALVNSARIVSTLFTMSEDEAGLFDLKPEEAFRYVRFDDAKANLTLMSGKARWFEKVGLDLPNGDSVGVLKPWSPPGVFDDISMDTIGQILAQLHAGRDGGKYLYNVKAGPEVTSSWAGHVIMSATGCDRMKANKMLAAWFKTGLILATEYPSENRHAKVGVKVDFSKKPGVEK